MSKYLDLVWYQHYPWFYNHFWYILTRCWSNMKWELCHRGVKFTKKSPAAFSCGRHSLWGLCFVMLPKEKADSSLCGGSEWWCISHLSLEWNAGDCELFKYKRFVSLTFLHWISSSESLVVNGRWTRPEQAVTSQTWNCKRGMASF